MMNYLLSASSDVGFTYHGYVVKGAFSVRYGLNGVRCFNGYPVMGSSFLLSPVVGHLLLQWWGTSLPGGYDCMTITDYDKL
jgi:hypothetical protein